MTDMTERLEIQGDGRQCCRRFQAMFAEFMGAFEEFKRTNEGRLKELEEAWRRRRADRGKLGRLNAALDGAKAAMDRLSPAYFPLAGGLGLAEEAGAEAILPLARGSDGRLGVSAGGGAVNVTFNVTASIARGALRRARRNCQRCCSGP